MKRSLEESQLRDETIHIKRFDWFGGDEERKMFVHPENIEELSWSDYESQIEDALKFDPSEIDSKVQELVLPDWKFDFDSYQDWLENFSVELRKEVDDYVYREYPDLINFDPSEIASKIEELTYSDWTLDFMSYEDWLQQFPPKLEERIRKHVLQNYTKYFCDNEDEVGRTIRMEGPDGYYDQDEPEISNSNIRHWNRNRKSKGRPQYNELDDYPLAA